MASSEGFLTEEQREMLKVASQSVDILSSSPKSPSALMSEHHAKSPKDGAGGKGTWGKLLDTGCESPVDRNDPNYDSGEESTVRDPPDDYKKAVVSLIKEYFSTGDVNAASSDLRELGSNKYHPYFIKWLISIAMDRHDKEKEMASVLLSALYAHVITPTSISQGFLMLLECADDLAVDILDAVDILALFIARAVVNDILPPAFVTRAKKEFPPLTKGLLVLETAQKSYLSVPHHAELVERRWGGSTHVTVEEMKNKISDLLREYVESGDTSEACRCIRQLGVAFFHHEVVKRALILSMEIRTTEPAILKLLEEAADEGLISSSQMLKGFTRVAESLDDLALDIPSAKTFFQSLVPHAVTGGWLDASFLKFFETNGEVHEKDSAKLKLYKKEAVSIIHEYFLSDDIPKLVRSLKDLRAPEFNPIFLKKLITLAMDRKNREREMASVLLSPLHIEIFSTKYIVDGFVMLLESAEDTALDVLDASNELALFLARSVIDGVLVPLNLEEIGSRLPRNCRGSETLNEARSLLAASNAGERILRCWGGGAGLTVDDAVDSPTTHLKKCLDRIRENTKCKLQSMHKTVFEVYMDFIQARESPASDEIRVESSKALRCYVQGDLELEPNNQQVHAFLTEIMPSKEERQERKELIEKLTKYITEIWPRAKVVSYGSFGSGLSLKDSDINLTIFKYGLFKDKDNVWTAGDHTPQNELCSIHTLMCEKGMLRVATILGARVPIVKCVNPAPPIDVDISLNGIDGFLNTKLLSSIQTFDQRIPNLSALVKSWARVNNLKFSTTQGREAYQATRTYNLMVVNFCQMHGIALVLHHESMMTFKVKMEEGIFGFCEHNSGDMANKANNRLTLYELLKSFFRYWAREYNYCDDVVSVRTGKTISRKESQCWRNRPRFETIVIEDPFRINNNVCGSLQRDQLKKMRKEFATAARLLERNAKSWIDKYRPNNSHGRLL